MIDAHFLLSLPSGRDVLSRSDRALTWGLDHYVTDPFNDDIDESQVSYVVPNGNGPDMLALGLLAAPLTVEVDWIPFKSESGGDIGSTVEEKRVKFLVVLNLPVPVHLGKELEGPCIMKKRTSIRENLRLLPENYQNHPYHSSNDDGSENQSPKKRRKVDK